MNFLTGDFKKKVLNWRSRFFILKLQLALSRLRWKQWKAFYLHLGPEAQASSLCICPYDWRFKAWESPLDPSLIWTTYLFPKENHPVFPISLYGFLQNAALLCCSRNVTGFVTMCYSSDFCSCKHTVKSKRYFIFFYTWKKKTQSENTKLDSLAKQFPRIRLCIHAGHYLLEDLIIPLV